MERATADIVGRMLDSYEGSKAYGSTEPWRRDVILHLDAKRFPKAFAPDGREELEDLREAAARLEVEGALRVTRATGLAGSAPRTLRLGAAELDVAYRLGLGAGFVPLATVVAKVRERVDLALALSTVGWMRLHLESVREALSRGSLTPLGIGRPRLKEEWREVADALLAASALAPGVDAWERVVSERLFSDSKRLGAVRPLIADVLRRADPQWDGVDKVGPEDLLAAYGVRRRPGVIRCAGGGLMDLGARAVDLRDFQPTAYVPETWMDAWVRGVVEHGIDLVTTIENEYPFFSYVEECGGAGELASRRELAIYLGGFPPPFLIEVFRRLCAAASSVRFRHWGDADVGGVRIWWLLRTRLDRPVDLFRTTGEWIRQIDPETARAFTMAELHALRRFRAMLCSRERERDIVAAIDLVDSLLVAGVKVEQERAT